ncbi:MAG TPA: hypothetical protein VLT79_06365, partial [Gemmatimonadales bacterium]|nr:hypothetical protein [Gemmatimonadales bacterium]
MIERIGRTAVGMIEAVGRCGQFLRDMTGALPDVGIWGRPALLQMRRVGVDSLPVALYIAAFTGVVL